MADSIIIATGAVARRLPFRGSDEGNGFWNKGISACAVSLLPGPAAGAACCWDCWCHITRLMAVDMPTYVVAAAC